MHHVMADINNRRHTKVALFFTFGNVAGMILGALPAFIVTEGSPFFLRALIVLLAAGLGFGATLDIGGLAFYEQVVWSVRGWLALRLSGTRLTPERLNGARAPGRSAPARPVGGVVRPITVDAHARVRQRSAGRATPILAGPARPIHAAMVRKEEVADADSATDQRAH